MSIGHTDLTLHNRFDINIVRNGNIIQTAYAENIILNALWTRLLSPSTYFTNIFFGTGTGVLDVARTSLFTYLGYKAATDKVINWNWEEGWVSSTKKIRLAPEEFVGLNLSEVGIAYGATTTNLVTHAFLKNSNGDIITILKTDSDVIDIYATVYVRFNPLGYDNGKIKIVPSLRNVFLFDYLTGDYFYSTSQYSSQGTSNHSLPRNIVLTKGGIYGVELSAFAYLSTETFRAALDGDVSTKYITATYDAPNRKLILSSRIAVDKSNYGIKNILFCSPFGVFNGAGNATSNLVPAISCEVGGSWYPGTSIVLEQIGVGDSIIKDFKSKYVIHNNAKIYVDGIEVTEGIIINYDQPKENNALGQYFQLISSDCPYAQYFAINASYSQNDWSDFPGEATNIYYNPNYLLGVKQLTPTYYSSSVQLIYVSDDMITWDVFSLPISSSAVFQVPEQFWYKKYWKRKDIKAITKLTTDTFNEFNIHFDTPPAVGAVITTDYFTESIAKDVDHVFDFSLTLTLNPDV